MSPNLMIIIIGVVACVALLWLGQATIAGFSAYRQRFTAMARSQLEEAFVFTGQDTLFMVKVVGTFVAAPLLGLLTHSLALALLIAALANVLPRVYLRMMSKRRRLKMVLQLPDVMLMLASSLRAGTSLQIALDLAIRETPAPLSQELGVVVREQRLGLALEDALETMATRLKLEDVELVVTAMTIARDVGGNLAETLDRLAATLRAKATMEGKIRALTSQGKLQGVIVGLLPIFLMLVLSRMQHDAMMPLFNTWIGWGVLGVIGILELIGFLMIKKIITIDI